MNYLEILGTIVGLVYLWLEYKASINLWIVGIIMPAIYLFVYYKAGLYADFGINIYYLLVAIYGWILWSFKKTKDSKEDLVKIKRMPKRYYFPFVIIFIILFFLIAYILSNYTDSDVPYLDSFTTSLSIVAMWSLTQKHVEQWLAWIAVDMVSCGLYIYKGLYFTSALYGLYTIIAYFGFLKWIEMLKKETK